MLPTQRVVQICLFLFTAIAIFGGTLQMYLGEPDTTPRPDNIHRFLAGVYLASGLICFWAAVTVKQQKLIDIPHCIGRIIRSYRSPYFHGHCRTSSTLYTMDHLSASGTCCPHDHYYQSVDHK